MTALLTQLAEQQRLRIEARRQQRALEAAERRMAAAERVLEDGLDRLDEDMRHAELTIDANLRTVHWGRDPERLPHWRRP
jgi:hypothetical protein